jgi:hypothetical protein
MRIRDDLWDVGLCGREVSSHSVEQRLGGRSNFQLHFVVGDL